MNESLSIQQGDMEEYEGIVLLCPKCDSSEWVVFVDVDEDDPGRFVWITGVKCSDPYHKGCDVKIIAPFSKE